MSCQTHHLFTAQEVLHLLQDIATDDSDGEDSELDLDGENFDEESVEEETGDGYSSGNKQLTGSDFSDSSGEGSSENSDDDYEPIAKCQKGTAASTSRSSKNSHSSVDKSQCEESVGSEGEGSESDENAVAKSQPRQNAVSNAYSGKDETLWYKSVLQVGRANAANVLQQAPGLPLQSRRVKTHLDSHFLFINPAMIRKILKHTNASAEARRVNRDQFDFGLGKDEFLASLGLLSARGVLCAKNEPLNALWSRDYGRDIF